MTRIERVQLAALIAALLMLAGVCDLLLFLTYGQAPVHPVVGSFAVLAGVLLAVVAGVARHSA